MRQFFLLATLLATPVLASYRVHQLKLTYYDTSGKPVHSEVVLSNLDQLQYEHYHGGYGVMRVELMDTWYCPGDTSHRGYCRKPKEKPARDTASTVPNSKPSFLPYNRQPVIP